MSTPVSYYPVRAADPGQGLGIAALVLALCGFSVVPLVLGLVALHQSRRAGFSNGFAIAGVVIGAMEVLLFLIFGSAILLAVMTAFTTR